MPAFPSSTSRRWRSWASARSRNRPKVITAPDGTDAVAIRTMGMLTMSYDHRVVDGADADKFLADVKKLLQEFPEGAV